ncbi:hypothetical protein BC826DRAFT_251587 [Russula brevipes]|nr:hypothetical protein BC826DRAFT_251587 [Russula brevipes]
MFRQVRKGSERSGTWRWWGRWWATATFRHRPVPSKPMALDPVPPPPPNPNPNSTPSKTPPDKPPDPLITAPENFFSTLFPGYVIPGVPSNPYRGPFPDKLREEHQTSLNQAKATVKNPFIYALTKPLEISNPEVGTTVSSDDLNAAVDLVIAALEAGYYPARSPTLVSTEDWVRLSCALLAAVGRGYNYQSPPRLEKELEEARSKTVDSAPLQVSDKSLFHRLATTASQLEVEIHADLPDFNDWFRTLQREFNQKAARAASIEVEEVWRSWKAEQIDCRAAAQEAEIARKARDKNLVFFYRTAQEIGLQQTFEGQGEPPQLTPVTGNKRTASGSVPKQRPGPPPSGPSRTQSNTGRQSDPGCPHPQTGEPPPNRQKHPIAHSNPIAHSHAKGAPSHAKQALTVRATDPSPTPRPKRAPPSVVHAIGSPTAGGHRHRPGDRGPAAQPGGPGGAAPPNKKRLA